MIGRAADHCCCHCGCVWQSAVVVGAGVAGLKAAAELHERGYHVTVIEARDVRQQAHQSIK